MAFNLFDYLKIASPREGAPAPWAARSPRRPRRFDLKLVPRSATWQDDPDALAVLAQIEAEPWVAGVKRERDGVEVRLTDSWIETTGAGLEAGGSAEATLSDLAGGQRYSVQFWDANATKALHVGHLRNLAIGNALASALTQAGGQVERRSLISDAGRSMGEAMAGVTQSGRGAGAWSDGDGKSDHFVGVCYADYVAAAGSITGNEVEHPDDSQTRELTVRYDDADDLLKRVLTGDPDTLELWYKTRAWVIAGQRKTLARLGVAFDRVFFESDFLADAAELTASGLREGRFKRRDDGVVVYPTGLDDFSEFPLVRPDGVTTQHMRALAYWMAAPDLDHMTSMQICGAEWVAHVTCRRKLMDELLPNGNGGLHPTHDIFNAMVARQKRALASSEGALLIDEVIDWLDERLDADPTTHKLRQQHPAPERMAPQIALGYFLPYPVARPMEFDQQKLLRDKQSVGWDLVRARARHSGRVGVEGGRPADDPEYRFAVVQSELYRQHLRLAVERLDVGPLALYLKHLARWSMERDRGEHVERVVQTLLDRSARGLGLEVAR
ncbi:MAG: Arginyl-tRNA synthetase-like protein [Frankiales bacterium]|nr:Arginyl-tRNA synthetase-like protein [Frankiales bacterium]